MNGKTHPYVYTEMRDVIIFSFFFVCVVMLLLAA